MRWHITVQDNLLRQEGDLTSRLVSSMPYLNYACCAPKKDCVMHTSASVWPIWIQCNVRGVRCMGVRLVPGNLSGGTWFVPVHAKRTGVMK